MSARSAGRCLTRLAKALPHYHRVFLSFPAARTLQNVAPTGSCIARQRAARGWGGAFARTGDVDRVPLFRLHRDTFSNTFHVTAAQNKEVETLLDLAKTLRLRLATITPDASALANLLPALAPTQCVAARCAPLAVGYAPSVGASLYH